MPRLINRDGAVQPAWVVWSDAEDPSAPVEITPRTLIPLKHWLVVKEDVFALSEVGVLLEGNENPQELSADLDRIQVIGVRFAAFTDGRGYSIARLLRQRFNYRGELHAIGDIGRDQLLDLWRCGFDHFEVQDSLSADESIQAWSEFSIAYQADARNDALFATTSR